MCPKYESIVYSLKGFGRKLSSRVVKRVFNIDGTKAEAVSGTKPQDSEACHATSNFLLECSLMNNNRVSTERILAEMRDQAGIHPRLAIEAMLLLPKQERVAGSTNYETCLATLDCATKGRYNVDDWETLLNVIQLQENSSICEKYEPHRHNEYESILKILEGMNCEWLHPRVWLMLDAWLPETLANDRRKVRLDQFYNAHMACPSRVFCRHYATAMEETLNLNVMNKTPDLKLISSLSPPSYKSSALIPTNVVVNRHGLLECNELQRIPEVANLQNEMISVLSDRLNQELLKNEKSKNSSGTDDDSRHRILEGLLVNSSDARNLAVMITNSILLNSRNKAFNAKYKDLLSRSASECIESYYWTKWRYHYRMDHLTKAVNATYGEMLQLGKNLVPRFLYTQALLGVASCTRLVEPAPMSLFSRHDGAAHFQDIVKETLMYSKMGLLFLGDKKIGVLPSSKIEDAFKSGDKLTKAEEHVQDLRYLALAECQVTPQSHHHPHKQAPLWTSLCTNTVDKRNKPLLKTLGTMEHYSRLSGGVESSFPLLGPLMDTVNKLNAVNLSINPKIKETVSHFLSHPKKYTKVKGYPENSGMRNNIEGLLKLSGKPFSMKHEIDSRGRCYQTIQLSSFVDKHILRGLLIFAKPKPVGEKGLSWLKIVVATAMLGTDAQYHSQKQLISFCDNRFQEVIDTPKNPIKKKWWQTCKNPWFTLAACTELRNSNNNPKYCSALPIQLDGTCHMFQHLAALCNDAVLQKYVRFDADFGQKVFTPSLYDHLVNLATKNVSIKVPTIDGNPVFTRDFFKLVLFLTMTQNNEHAISIALQKRISPETYSKYQVVLKEREDELNKIIHKAMPKVIQFKNWLDEAIKQIAETRAVPTWTTPHGFPVNQFYFVINSRGTYPKACHTNGLFNLTSNEMKTTPDVRKHRDSIMHNLTQSLEAALMMSVTLECQSQGIDIIQNHDGFSTHPCDIPTLNGIIRRKFIEMYSNDAVMETFVKNLADVKHPVT